MAADPRLIAAIRQQPRYLQVPLLTTALIESGGRLNAVGDSGRSHGPYQMYDLGRGAGVPISKRRDPVFSTQSAAAEFQTFYDRGARGASLAYRAQRPADQGNYISKYNQYLPEAKRLLGQSSAGSPPAPGGSADEPSSSPAAAGGRQLTAGSLEAIRQYAVQSRADVLAGRRAAGVETVLPQLKYTAAAPISNPGGPAAPGANANAVAAGPPAPGAMVPGFKPGSPVPGQRAQSSTHPTSGLSGYPAYDYMAPAGTKVAAPVGGKIVRLSGKDPRAGGAPGGPLGYSIYLQGNDGRSYYLTHIDKVGVTVGQNVRQGQQIAVVAAGPASWSSPHVHMGVRG